MSSIASYPAPSMQRLRHVKVKLSISVDEETALKVMNSIRQGRFRNKSHAFEYSVNKVMEVGE
ncbi:hypothetical protein KY348_03935 [Candidatus Woesearchaeota archaeon]|nr:hypothetical protein [Candidatus Woesearchaeota archaeon]